MKQALTAMLSIAFVTALLGAGTLAYFTDSETSSGNTFTTGTLDLKTSDNSGFDPDPIGDGVDMTWVLDDMKPGNGVEVTNHVTLRNVGSIDGDHLEISFSHSIDETTNPVESDTDDDSTPGDLARYIQITTMQYDGVNLLSSVVNANSNTWIDLEDVTLSPNTDDHGPLDDLPAPNSVGGEPALTMTLSFRPEASNDLQGDILTTTVTFTLNQHSSQ